MSDRIISIAQVYMAMYSTEISIVAALLLGGALGAWIFFEHGKDKGISIGHGLGYKEGWMDCRRISQPKRDRKGRFTA